MVGVEVPIGEGAPETEGALRLLESLPGNHRVTVGADKLCDNRSFVGGRSGPACDAARDSEPDEVPQPNRRPDGPSSRLHGKRAQETCGGGPDRLDEAVRPASPANVQRLSEDELGDALQRRLLQHPPNRSPGGCGMTQQRVDAVPRWRNRVADHASRRAPSLNPSVAHANARHSPGPEPLTAFVKPQPKAFKPTSSASS